nr:immunoglobulin heavy chain junction region [Mus musculus]
ITVQEGPITTVVATTGTSM